MALAGDFYGDIELHNSQIKNGKFEKLPAPPTNPETARFYFNTTDSHFYGWNGLEWLNFGTLDEHLLAIQEAKADALEALASCITKAGESATSAAAALASKNASKTSETNAKTSETNSKTSENAAKVSETNSKTSETNASTTLTTFRSEKTDLVRLSPDVLVIDNGFTPTFGSAAQTGIDDVANRYTSSNVEGALQEVGAKFASVDSQLADSMTKINTSTSKIANLESYVGFTDTDIYGVEVDMVNKTFTRLSGAVGKTAGANFDSIKAFGGRRRCNLTDNGKVLTYYGETGYTETGALTQQIIKNGVTYPIGTAVQVMVEQPKYYYKTVPLLLEKIEFKELDTLTVTAGATVDGNITINLGGVPFTVAVLATDNTPTLVATKIRAATYAGWVTGGTGATVTFTATVAGTKTTATFAGGTTGATATVAKTQPGYIGKGYHLRKARYYMSDFPKEGFKIHPGHIVNGGERNFIYFSAFEGSIFDVSALTYILDDAQIADFTATTGDKLCSIANAKPTSGLTQQLTRANVRKLAQNRGAGWQQTYAATVACSQMLFMIEYASFNSQTAIGMGNVSKVDDGATNMAEKTGGSSSIGNASGSVTNINGIQIISYRGEENIWGNIYKYIDGVNVYAYGEHSLYVADNGFADGIKSIPYNDAGVTLAKTNGYISAFAYSIDCDWIFFASECVGSSALPVGDMIYQNSQVDNWLIARLGSYDLSPLALGTFCLDMANISAAYYRNIGGRLVYVG